MSSPGVAELPMIANGCYHHSDCFTCPFPDCILPVNTPTGTKKMRSEVRKGELDAIGEMFVTGFSRKEMAERLRITPDLVSERIKYSIKTDHLTNIYRNTRRPVIHSTFYYTKKVIEKRVLEATNN